jgi:hypothetical protein
VSENFLNRTTSLFTTKPHLLGIISVQQREGERDTIIDTPNRKRHLPCTVFVCTIVSSLWVLEKHHTNPMYKGLPGDCVKLNNTCAHHHPLIRHPPDPSPGHPPQTQPHHHSGGPLVCACSSSCWIKIMSSYRILFSAVVDNGSVRQ